MASARYSIRQIVDTTGLSEFNLRSWELRYGAFEPHRSATGRRQYSIYDLQKALLLRELIKRHHRIGDIAELKIAQLKFLLQTEIETTTLNHSVEKQISAVEKIMKLLALQDWDSLGSEIFKVTKTKKPLDCICRIIIPLFAALGREVNAGRLSIAQEHIMSSLLRQQLYRLAKPTSMPSRIKFLIASPEGDFHELGILTAQAMASQLKIRSLYLGPNSPKKDLCETALRFGATHILLASTVSKKDGAKDDFFSFVNFLDRNLPSNIHFWLAGRASSFLSLKRKTLILESLSVLEKKLIELKENRVKYA